MRKKNLGKAFTMFVSAVLAATMTVTPVFAASNEASKKDETVYVKLDAQGNEESVTVSDYLKNGKKNQTIKDETNLSKVENVKGDETFEQGKGDQITWNAKGNDIYYQGKTDQELPVGMTVTYSMDGKEMAPDKIVGKSGEVKIKYEFSNNSPKTVDIDGKATTLYTPFIVVTGAILPTEHFSNVKIDNGKVISDGTKHIVIGVTFPGFNQSLNLGDTNIGMEMPESFEVTADAKDFELNVTASVASADMLSDLGLDDAADLSDLQASLNKLKDSSKQLVDGSGELLAGVKTLQSSTKEFNAGVQKVDKNMKVLSKGLNTLDSKDGELVTGTKELAAGSKELQNGTKELETKTKDLPSSTTQLNAGAKEILEKVKAMVPSASEQQQLQRGITASNAAIESIKSQLSKMDDEIVALSQMDKTGMSDEAKADIAEVIRNLSTEKATIKGQLEQALEPTYKSLRDGMLNINSNLPTLVAGLTNLQGGTQQLADSSSALANGIKEANQGAKQLAEGSSQVAAGTKQLSDGIGTAAAGGKKLSKGTGQLSTAGDKLVAGVGTLTKGTQILNDGMIQFDQQGIQKLVHLINDNAKGVLERADKLIELGNDYTTFTKKTKGTKGTVKFMMETEEIDA